MPEEIHETLKLTAFLPLKINGWKMKFPFRECLFSGVTLFVSERVHVTQLSIKEAHWRSKQYNYILNDDAFE